VSSPTGPDSTAAAIDVHAHLVPPGLLDAARAGALPGVRAEGPPGVRAEGPPGVFDAGEGGGPVLAAGADRLGPVGPDMTDLDGRLRWMDARSIAEQWVSPWLDLFTFHRFGPADGRRWAAAVNEALAAAARSSGGRLRPVPFVDLSAGAAAAADDVTALAERLGPPAVLLSTHPPGMSSVADESLGPLWKRIAELGLPVLLHPPGNGPSRAFTPPVLQNVAGRITDTSAAVLQMMTDGLFDRLPGLRVIVVHGGGFLPYQAYRLDGLVRSGLLGRTGMTAAPSSVLRRLFYDTVALDALSLEFLVRRVGADRVLLGSDTPFPIGNPDPVATVCGTDLDDAVKQRICIHNAAALASPAR
jgi:aminocarboxymuconate-semialdehyde decarboxylase